ncbi:PIN domain-like protein, partial [Mycena galericulata]
LKSLFYKCCNLQHAPVTVLSVFDGPGRPRDKRGIRRIRNNPRHLTALLKQLLTSFGYYHYTAPGEAEAELAQLNKLGFIDVVITEDSDTLAFGATCVLRTSGFVHFIHGLPYVTDPAEIYTSASIASHPVDLDEDGLLLFALLVGGDYDRGVPQCGHKIAHGLARCGFGRELRQILTAPNHANDLERTLAAWRSALKSELTTNSSDFLDKRHPKLAGNIGGDFPNLDIVKLYTNSLTSRSSDFTGTAPDPSLWIPCEPCVHEVATFASHTLDGRESFWTV